MCDFFLAETTGRTLHLDVLADAIVRACVRVCGAIAGRMELVKLVGKSGSKMIHSRKSLGRVSSPSMHSDTGAGATSASRAPLSHDGLRGPPGGCVPFQSGRAGGQKGSNYDGGGGGGATAPSEGKVLLDGLKS